MKGWVILIVRLISLLVLIVGVALFGHDLFAARAQTLVSTATSCGGAISVERNYAATITTSLSTARAGAPFALQILNETAAPLQEQGFQVWYVPTGGEGSVASSYLDALGLLVAQVPEKSGTTNGTWTPPTGLPSGNYMLVPYYVAENTAIERGQATSINLIGTSGVVHLLPDIVQTDQADTITSTATLHTTVFATNPTDSDRTVKIEWVVTDPLQPTVSAVKKTSTYDIPAHTASQEIDAVLSRSNLSLMHVAVTLTDGNTTMTETFEKPGALPEHVLPVAQNGTYQKELLGGQYSLNMCIARLGQAPVGSATVTHAGKGYVVGATNANKVVSLVSSRYLLPLHTVTLAIGEANGLTVQQSLSIPHDQSLVPLFAVIALMILAALTLFFAHYKRVVYQEKL